MLSLIGDNSALITSVLGKCFENLVSIEMLHQNNPLANLCKSWSIWKIRLAIQSEIVADEMLIKIAPTHSIYRTALFTVYKFSFH